MGIDGTALQNSVLVFLSHAEVPIPFKETRTKNKLVLNSRL